MGRYKNKIVALVIMGMIFGVAIFNVVYKMGVMPIQSWDEARHGVNAYEMLRNGEWIVNTYGDEIDYWNLKPPLSMWILMISMKIFGANIVAIRIPSAIIFIITLILVAIFTYKKYGEISAIITLSVLATSPYIINYHAARTGDADSIFCFLVVISMMALTKSISNKKYYIFISIAFSLAFLTKSWHAFIIPAIMLSYLIFTKDLFKIKFNEILMLVVPALVPISTWILLRISSDGIKFMKEMVDYDLFKRTSQVIEKHNGRWSYYLELIFQGHIFWIVLLLVTIYVVLKEFIIRKNVIKNKKEIDKELIILILWFVIPIILYSLSSSKRGWYIATCIYPMAIIISLFVKRAVAVGFKEKIDKMILIGLILISLGTQQIMVLSLIKLLEPDSVQVLITKVSENDKIKGLTMYVDYDYYGVDNDRYGPMEIRQEDLLASELYLDVKYKKGGIEKFKEEDERSLLIISKSKINELVNLKYNIISENDSEYIVLK